jgi:Phosphate-starvation-inducible E family
MPGERISKHFGNSLRIAELGIYFVTAILLASTALAALVNAGTILYQGIRHGSLATDALRVLDQLLLVLMLVEILHTVRISIRSHILLATEPFLVVGLIAAIRRVLVISLEVANVFKTAASPAEASGVFRASMIELSLLIVLVLVFVVSITLLRRYAPEQTEGLEKL